MIHTNDGSSFPKYSLYLMNVSIKRPYTGGVCTPQCQLAYLVPYINSINFQNILFLGHWAGETDWGVHLRTYIFGANEKVDYRDARLRCRSRLLRLVKGLLSSRKWTLLYFTLMHLIQQIHAGVPIYELLFNLATDVDLVWINQVFMLYCKAN